MRGMSPPSGKRTSEDEEVKDAKEEEENENDEPDRDRYSIAVQ